MLQEHKEVGIFNFFQIVWILRGYAANGTTVVSYVQASSRYFVAVRYTHPPDRSEVAPNGP